VATRTHQLYVDEVQCHFIAEEQVLFPAARRFAELAPLVLELGGEHERLREYFLRAQRQTLDQGGLQDFWKLLTGHIRKEERLLFEGLQKQLTQDEMKLLGAALAGALKDAARVCRLGSSQAL